MTKTTENKTKKRLIISQHNLPQELQEQLRLQYPNGFTDAMIRIDKGPGDFFYAVVLETEDINYLVKVDVKIDDDIRTKRRRTITRTTKSTGRTK